MSTVKNGSFILRRLYCFKRNESIVLKRVYYFGSTMINNAIDNPLDGGCLLPIVLIVFGLNEDLLF